MKQENGTTGMKISGKVALAASEYGEERDYWLNKLAGEIVKTSFPAAPSGTENIDPRENESQPMKSVKTRLEGSLFLRLMKVSKRSHYTLHMILAAAVTALLNKYTGNKDIIVGTPIYKQETGKEFLNTVLVLRNQLPPHMSFQELLLQVRQTIVEANDNQNYPVETLLYHLKIPFSGKDFPLFDTVVLLRDIHDEEYIRYTSPNIIFSFLNGHDHLESTLKYNPLRYDKSTAEQINRHFSRLLECAIFNVDMEVSAIDILSPQEKQQLLVEFNQNRTGYPDKQTIAELFDQQAERTPGKLAVLCGEDFLTYGRLQEQAKKLAAHLCAKGLHQEEAVGIMAENSHYMVVGILGILQAGGAYLPLNPYYPEERKNYLLRDACVRRLLTYGCLIGDHGVEILPLDNPTVYENLPHGMGDLYAAQFVCVDFHSLPGEGACDSLPQNENSYIMNLNKSFTRETGGLNLAYIMHTSGSTGAPKGILVTHRSVARLVKNTNYVEFQEKDRILQTGALEFDASTFEIWGALLNGLSLCLVGKEVILTPGKLKDAVQRYAISTMWMTSPLFNQVLEADVEIFRGIRNLIVGGETLSPSHINRVRREFPGLNVINGYGPTENTTFSITHRIDREYKENIPIGKPIANSTVYIFNERGMPRPIGAAGEIYAGGDGLARGYLNNPELTAEKFDHDLYDYQDYHEEEKKVKNKKNNETLLRGVQGGAFLEKSPPGRRRQQLYRTGDLGRWLPGGVVEFLGRMDHQVKIRGYRIEPGEIENHLTALENIREAVVIDRKNAAGEKYLCAYVVSVGTIDTVQLKSILAGQLPEYMVPSYFVQLDEISLTPNGKVDRRALPEPDEAGAAENYVAPRNPMEEKFVRVWSEVLGVKEETIGIDSDFFELGGHSLKATILLTKLHKELNVKLPLAELFRTPTIRELVEFIKGEEEKVKEEQFESIKPVELKDYYVLSSAQKRLYVHQQVNPEDTSYNVPSVIILEKEPERTRLEKAFIKLLQRHESLRTSIETVEGKPMQRIHDHISFTPRYYEAGEKGAAEIIRQVIRPFDLSSAPLMRAALVKENENRYILIVDIHHIVTDGTSMDILTKEFNSLMTGKELSPLKLRYKDYAEWQNSDRHKEMVKKQETYWLKGFAGELPRLNLPTDFPRPPKQSFEGDMKEFNIGKDHTAALNEMAKSQGATLYIVLLALYSIFLAKLCRQDEIIIGVPIAGRTHADLQKIAGMFINVLAIRSYPQPGKIFKEFLEEVKLNTLQAYENQDYQFDDLVAALGIQQDMSRAPLAETHFVLENMSQFQGTSHQEYPAKLSEKLDLSLISIEIAGEIVCRFSYKTRLFMRETIAKFGRQFLNITAQVLENPRIPLGKIQLLSGKEKNNILNQIQQNKEIFGQLKQEDFNEAF
jgi:amino acid adenylation domain-containing protein